MKKLFILLILTLAVFGCSFDPYDLSDKTMSADVLIQAQDFEVDTTVLIFVVDRDGYDYVFERQEDKTVLVAKYDDGDSAATAVLLFFIGAVVGLLIMGWIWAVD